MHLLYGISLGVAPPGWASSQIVAIVGRQSVVAVKAGIQVDVPRHIPMRQPVAKHNALGSDVQPIQPGQLRGADEMLLPVVGTGHIARVQHVAHLGMVWVAHAAPDGGLVDARFLALLCLLDSAAADLPSGVSRFQHLEHNTPCTPRMLHPQAWQVGCCRGLRLDLTQQREHRTPWTPRVLPSHAWQISGRQGMPAFRRAYQPRWRWALVGSLSAGIEYKRRGPTK